MRRTVLIAACLTVLLGCGPGGDDAAGTGTPDPGAASVGAAPAGVAPALATSPAEDGRTGHGCSAEQSPEADPDGFEYPPFSCDMGLDGIPVCEGDVPESVGVHRTPDGVLVGG